MSKAQKTAHGQSRPRYGLVNGAAKLVKKHRTALAFTQTSDEPWTITDVPFKPGKLKKFKKLGIVTVVDEEDHGSFSRYQYRLTEGAEKALSDFLKSDSETETVCPCPCRREGFENIRDGGFACPDCGTEFERSELNT